MQRNAASGLFTGPSINRLPATPLYPGGGTSMEDIRKPRFLEKKWGFFFLAREGVNREVYKKTMDLKSAKELP
jgi:hypothetical protein